MCIYQLTIPLNEDLSVQIERNLLHQQMDEKIVHILGKLVHSQIPDFQSKNCLLYHLSQLFIQLNNNTVINRSSKYEN